MKQFLLIAVLGSGLGVAAQQPLQSKKLIDAYKQFRSDTTGNRLRDLNGLMLQRGLLPPATFSHETSRGKVYNLPIDNMPCLVPDMKQVKPMPGMYSTPPNRMPNAIPKQQIIPPKKEKH